MFRSRNRRNKSRSPKLRKQKRSYGRRLLAETLEDRRVLALFAPVATYSSGGLSDYNLAVADFNSDGHMDIVAADIDTGRGVGVLTNDGLGAFSTIILNTGSTPGYNVATGDFNGDNRPDIAVTSFSDVKVFLNTSPIGAATPTFAGAISTPASAYPIAAGELDGDGRLDLIVATNGTGPGIHFLKGLGNGQFTDQGALPNSTVFPFHDLALRDVNSDGNLDAVGATMFSNGVYVALGNGSGGFTFKGHYLAGGNGSRHIALGDLNGDGRLDVVTANQDNNNVSVLLGDGSGAFALSGTQPHTFSSGGSGPSSVGIADFNLDGWADVVVSNRNTDIVGVLLGNGAGVLDPVVTFFSGGFSAKDIVTGDFNNDSMPDVAVANTSSSNVGILLNTSFRGFFTPVAPDPRTEPVSSVDFTFTTDILPGDFDYNDLSLTFNGGGNLITPSVTVTSLGGNAYRIGNLAGLTAGDGNYLLTVFGSGIRDSNSNPLIGNATEFWTTDHKLPALNSVAPLGSLIYDPVETRSLPTPADVQNLQIDLDAGQKFSVRIEPTGTLQLDVTVLDPNNVAINSFTAAAAGDLVVLQNVPADTAGTYTISVGTVGGTTGDFTLQVFLNTDLELENNGGSSNDMLLDAQNVDDSFIDLNSGTAQRAAVSGKVGRSFYGVDRFTGLLSQFDMTTGATLGSVSMTVAGNPVTAAYSVAVDPTTNLVYALVTYSGVNTALVKLDVTTGVGTAISDVNASGQRFTEIAFDSAGTLYGLTGDRGTNLNSLFSINKTNGSLTLLAALQNFGGGTGESLAFNPDTGLLYRFQAGRFQSIDPNNSFAVTEIPVSGSNPFQAQGMTYIGGGEFRLVRFDGFYSLTAGGLATFIATLQGSRIHGLALIGGNTIDLYSFSLGANQTTTLAVGGRGSTVELLDGDGNVLTSGVAAQNVSDVISDFVAPSSGTYYARVTSLSLRDYSLIVTRDASFDTENNNTLATAQNIDATGVVLGHLSSIGLLLGADDGDLHLLSIDPDTGASTVLASNVGSGRGYNDLARNPVTGLLYATQAEGSTGFYSIDTTTFAETLIGNTGNVVFAMAWSPDGSTLYGYRNFDQFGTINPATGAFTVIGSTGIGRVGGMAFQPGTGKLFAVQNQSQGLYTIDLATGAASFVGNPGDRYNALEFLADGTLLAGVDRIGNSPGSLVELDPVTAVRSVIGVTIPSGFRNFTGLEALPATDDFYSFTVTAGDPIKIVTSTPADGPGEFVNDLDSQLELLDPFGVPVASDDNGALDGRNAVLTHPAFLTVSGTYTVRVFGANNTKGEYVLRLNPNEPPEADAGGDYVVDEGTPITLDGSGSTDADNDIATYEWDVDYDGVNFQVDAIGPQPSVSFADNFPSRSIALRVTDSHGEVDIATTTLTVNNVAPQNVNAGADQTVDEGDTVNLSGSFSDPGTADTHTQSWSVVASNGQVIPDGSGASFSFVPHDNGTYTVTYTVTDDDGDMTSDTAVLTVNNVAPVIDSLSATSVDENGVVHLTGTYSDVGTRDTHTLTINWSEGGPETVAVSGGSFDITHQYLDDNPTVTPSDTYTISVALTDDDTGSDSDSTSTTVTNLAPANVVINPNVSEYVFAVGAVKEFSTASDFSDVGVLDTHSAVWTFSRVVGLVPETEYQDGIVTQGSGSGSVSNNFSFDEPGVYTVTLTVTDDDSGATTSAPLTFVVYDPSEGFVTGGGWINSPAGAYADDPSLTGKANFGFVSKYKKGANVPTGQTEFQFKAGNLNFHSSSYEWLVVAGARAKYKGVGKINGAGNYGFMLTAIDGQSNGGGGVDKFRMKIWDKDNGDAIVYDNQIGANDDATPTTALGGGQIVIHKNGNNLTGASIGTTANGAALTQSMLDSAVAEAISQWSAAGVSQRRLAAVSELDVGVAQLSGAILGLASSSTNKIWLDADAAGIGWSTDITGGGYHLVSAVSHEIGHALGLDHDVMGELLEPGEIHLPGEAFGMDHGLPRLDHYSSGAFSALDAVFDGFDLSGRGARPQWRGTTLRNEFSAADQPQDWRDSEPNTDLIDSLFGSDEDEDEDGESTAGVDEGLRSVDSARSSVEMVV